MSENTTEIDTHDAVGGLLDAIVILPCPLCGKKADHWYVFDIARAGCSDDKCPCAFGDDGIDADAWNTRPKTRVSADVITGFIADKFPEIFDMESQDYGKLHKLEELGNEIVEKLKEI